jgi:hypothetical protein
MDFFLDSCIMIRCIEQGGEPYLRILNRLVGSGHTISTSITLIGESVHQCALKSFDAQEIVGMIRDFDIRIIYPSIELRPMCTMMDDMVLRDGPYGSSATDRTHFAYAIVAQSHFFVTSQGETRCLRTPDQSDSEIRTAAVTMQWVKEELLR